MGKQSRNNPQPDGEREESDSLQVVAMIGSGGEDRTPDLGIMSRYQSTDSKENQQVASVNSGKVRQNSQPGRNQEPAGGKETESSTKKEQHT